MLSTISKELREYIDENERLYAKKREMDKKINNNKDYSVDYRARALKENNDKYLALLEANRKTHQAQISAYIRIARQTIYKMIVVELPADVNGTLDSMRAMGDAGALTEMTIEPLLDKYRKIYPAFNAVLSLAHKYGVCMDKICITPEVLESDLRHLEDLVSGCLNKRYEDNGLTMAIICENPYINLVNVRVNSFTQGYFDDPNACMPAPEPKVSVKEVEGVKVAGNFKEAELPTGTMISEPRTMNEAIARSVANNN